MALLQSAAAVAGHPLEACMAGLTLCTVGAGVYANGGPSTVDKRLTLENLIDRSNVPGGSAKQPAH